MGFTDRKLEFAILALSITMIGGLGYVLKTPVQNVITGADIIYEMPRIKKSFLASLFDLGDREIDRSYSNPFAKKAAAEKKKAEETKKAQAAAKKAAAKVAAKKAEEVKKPKVQVTTVEASPAKKWGDDGFFGNNNAARPYQTTSGGNSATDSEADKSDMSGDQWKALLRAQPTQENVNKLIAAFANKEIEADTFYAIVADLFSANKPETQALGLLAVKSFYNTRSFIITTQYYEQFTSEMQPQAHSYLLTYAVSGRLGILASVLKTTDIDAVTMAAQIVVEGHQSAKTGGNNNDPRNSRGNVVQNSLSGYDQFIPIFQELRGHQDASIVSLATSALTEIQQTTVAAVASM